MSEQRFIQALFRQSVDKVPVWFMRQAGRYLPEYRALRKQAGSFINLCKTPELACEVTLQPLRRFDFDAAILFSDILTVPDAMGLGLAIVEQQGPIFSRQVRNKKDIELLKVPDPERDLGYVMQTIRLVTKELPVKKPLIGFAGSPWTVATYMVEGKATKNFSIIKKMLYAEPILLHALLQRVTQATIDYLNAQVNAGVSAIMLFDSWGGILSEHTYEEFSLHYLQQIVAGLRNSGNPRTPIIIYGKQTHYWLEKIAATGCDAIGVDWTIELSAARARVGQKVALQGNLDPTILYANPVVIQREVLKLLEQVAHEPGYVFNLGHGILPDVPPEHVAVVVDTVHQFKINSSYASRKQATNNS